MPLVLLVGRASAGVVQEAERSTSALKPGRDRTEFRTEQTQRPQRGSEAHPCCSPARSAASPTASATAGRRCWPPPCRARAPTLLGLGHRQPSPRERPAGGRAPCRLGRCRRSLVASRPTRTPRRRAGRGGVGGGGDRAAGRGPGRGGGRALGAGGRGGRGPPGSAPEVGV